MEFSNIEFRVGDGGVQPALDMAKIGKETRVNGLVFSNIEFRVGHDDVQPALDMAELGRR